MTYSCLVCHRKVSPHNQKNLQCNQCKQFCHPICARYCPPLVLKKSGNHRYKIIRNENWQCNVCTLKEFPCTNISDLQLRELVIPHSKPFSIPPPEQLNDIFVQDTKNHEKVI